MLAKYADSSVAIPSLGTEHKAVKQVREYIESFFTRNISLKELSELTNLSSFYLSRLFKQELGLSIHSYLLQVRVNQAKKILSGGYSASYAATQTGFVDNSHLTRHFKRLVGVTPRQYIRRER